MFKRLSAAAFLLLLVSPPAPASDECRTGWDFGMVDDEGGPAPLAWSCPITANPALMVRCGRSQHFAVSYFEDPDVVQRDPDYTGEFEVTIGADTFRRKMLFQALDGSLITDDQPIDGPLIAAMRHGSSFGISSTDGVSARFDLAGSREALDQLVVLCAKSGN